MSITYKLTATETCEEREKIIRTREFKTCTGLNLKPGPASGSRTEARVRPGPARKSQGPALSGPTGRAEPGLRGPARPVQASVCLKKFNFGKSWHKINGKPLHLPIETKKGSQGDHDHTNDAAIEGVVECTLVVQVYNCLRLAS